MVHEMVNGNIQNGVTQTNCPNSPFSSSEHRAVMEAAFVYGTTYQFVLTTETALLESVGIEDIEHAHLYFFHCKPVLDLTHQCRKTLMEHPLTTLNIHRFIKTMEAPLLVCALF